MAVVCGAPSSMAGVTMPSTTTGTSGGSGGGSGGGSTSQCASLQSSLASLTTEYNNLASEYTTAYNAWVARSNYDIAHGIENDPELGTMVAGLNNLQNQKNSVYAQVEQISAEMQAAGCY